MHRSAYYVLVNFKIGFIWVTAQDLVSTMLSGASEIYSIVCGILLFTVHTTILKDLEYGNLLLKGIQCPVVTVSLYIYTRVAKVRILLLIDLVSLVKTLQVKSFFIAHFAHTQFSLVISHNKELSNWHNILVDQWHRKFSFEPIMLQPNQN